MVSMLWLAPNAEVLAIIAPIRSARSASSAAPKNAQAFHRLDGKQFLDDGRQRRSIGTSGPHHVVLDVAEARCRDRHRGVIPSHRANHSASSI